MCIASTWQAGETDDAAASGEANPWGASGGGATMLAKYPSRPEYKEFDTPLTHADLLGAERQATWQKRLGGFGYNRPEEVSGLAAMKVRGVTIRSTTTAHASAATIAIATPTGVHVAGSH